MSLIMQDREEDGMLHTILNTCTSVTHCTYESTGNGVSLIQALHPTALYSMCLRNCSDELTSSNDTEPGILLLL